MQYVDFIFCSAFLIDFYPKYIMTIFLVSHVKEENHMPCQSVSEAYVLISLYWVLAHAFLVKILYKIKSLSFLLYPHSPFTA